MTKSKAERNVGINLSEMRTIIGPCNMLPTLSKSNENTLEVLICPVEILRQWKADKYAVWRHTVEIDVYEPRQMSLKLYTIK